MWASSNSSLFGHPEAMAKWMRRTLAIFSAPSAPPEPQDAPKTPGLLTAMLTRALMDSHYGKPSVIARACREPRTAAGQPDRSYCQNARQRPGSPPQPLVFEKSRLSRSSSRACVRPRLVCVAAHCSGTRSRVRRHRLPLRAVVCRQRSGGTSRSKRLVRALEHVVALRREQKCDFAADFSCLCR
jgi:hypothetical protein